MMRLLNWARITDGERIAWPRTAIAGYANDPEWADWFWFWIPLYTFRPWMEWEYDRERRGWYRLYVAWECRHDTGEHSIRTWRE